MPPARTSGLRPRAGSRPCAIRGKASISVSRPFKPHGPIILVLTTTLVLATVLAACWPVIATIRGDHPRIAGVATAAVRRADIESVVLSAGRVARPSRPRSAASWNVWTSRPRRARA